MRIKSPGYPNVNLSQALDSTSKLFKKNRQNMIDREAATKDIGYSGLTGASTKMLSNLSHFGLIEKAGKGGVRVTQLAVRAIHPQTPEEGKAALLEAAYSPDLYAAIKEHWPDGVVSDNALRGYLAREGFASTAIEGAISSYAETYQFLQQQGATKSHGMIEPLGDDASGLEGGLPLVSATSGQARARTPPTVQPQTGGLPMSEGERVVFVEEGGPANYLKLVANGDLDETMLEALEDYIKRQKKRLAAAAIKPIN